MSAILKADPMDAPASAVHVTGALDPLLRHCLEKQPDERFQSARDLAFQLQAVASGVLSTGSAAAITGGRPRLRGYALAIAAAAVALTLGLSIGRTLLAPTVPNLRDVTTSLLLPPAVTMAISHSPARSGGLAVSPDGRSVAFVGSDEPGRTGIYVRALDGEAAVLVRGTENGAEPAWSPDGARLVFSVFETGKMMQVPVAGGTPQTIADVTNPRAAATWGPDGTLLYHDDYRGALLRVPAAGGTPTVILPAPEEGTSWFSPVWLDTKRFLVVRFHYQNRPEAAGVYVGTVDSQELRPLISGRISEIALGSGQLYYRRGVNLIAHDFDARSATISGEPRILSNHVSMVGAGGSTLAYYAPSGALSSGHRVVWMSRDGRELSQIAPSGTYRDPRLSPDGRHLAVARANEDGLFEIWAYELARGIDTRVTGPTFTSPVWSADGLAILAGQGNRVLRFRVGENASPETLMTVTEPSVSMVDVTPDGRVAIVRLSTDVGIVQQAALPLDGGLRRHLNNGIRSRGIAPTVAPSHGEWVVANTIVRGVGRLQAQRIDGTGPVVPVAGIAAAHPRFRRDGRELYFVSWGTSQRIMRVPVTWAGGVPAFGTPEALFEVPTGIFVNLGFDVTPDGQKFVLVVASPLPATPITVRVPAAVGEGQSR